MSDSGEIIFDAIEAAKAKRGEGTLLMIKRLITTDEAERARLERESRAKFHHARELERTASEFLTGRG